jgi:hypothetical protein
MVFFFGDVVVFNAAAAVKLVAFPQHVGGLPWVTLAGDMYDPLAMLFGLRENS